MIGWMITILLKKYIFSFFSFSPAAALAAPPLAAAATTSCCCCSCCSSCCCFISSLSLNSFTFSPFLFMFEIFHRLSLT